MKRGLVIGKFYPPHKGHHFLINTALSQTDQVTVIVCEESHETIPGALRAQWIKEVHPTVTVMVINSDNIDPDDSALWAELTIGWLGFRPDVVFTSEDYGKAYAYYMNCKHVMVDKPRKTVPISATKVRSNPYKYWEFLEAPVRAYYAKRIVIVGAESSGTTTLAKSLADYYKTIWVPEFGRTYYEGRMNTIKDTPWKSEEFAFIAQKQNEMEDELAKYSNKLLIADTDSWATTMWHQRYMGSRSAQVERQIRNRHADLYIVTDVDIPFVQDGTRDGQHIRTWMHNLFVSELKRLHKPFIIVSGKPIERLKKAVEAIENISKLDYGYQCRQDISYPLHNNILREYHP